MVSCWRKGCSNQSRLNENISHHQIQGQKKKDKKGCLIKAIDRPVLPKAARVCFYHFTKDSSEKSKELKQHLLGSNLKYILKPDAVASLFPNGKAINKSGSGYINFQQAFRKQKHLWLCSFLTKLQTAAFNTNRSKIEC